MVLLILDNGIAKLLGQVYMSFSFFAIWMLPVLASLVIRIPQGTYYMHTCKMQDNFKTNITNQEIQIKGQRIWFQSGKRSHIFTSELDEGYFQEFQETPFCKVCKRVLANDRKQKNKILQYYSHLL